MRWLRALAQQNQKQHCDSRQTRGDQSYFFFYRHRKQASKKHHRPAGRPADSKLCSLAFC